MDAERNNQVENPESDNQRMEKGARRYPRRRQRQTLPDYIDWKDVDFLKKYVH